MTKLSKTDRENLEALTTPSSTFKGTGAAMRKLVDAGLVARTTEKTPGGFEVFVYRTTEKGVAV